jgi:hypothetical protein
MAAVSMWFALSSAMGINPVAAIIPALAWGLVIMGIDRWLITSIPIDGNRRFTMAAPRILLAVLLGTLISTPLVLRIFESEINAQITVIKQERANIFLAQLEHSQIAAQVTRWRDDVANLENVIQSRGSIPINPAGDPIVESLTKQRNNEIGLQQHYYQQWQCQLYGGSGCPAGNGQLAKASQASYEEASSQVTLLTNEIQARQQQLSETDAASQRTRLNQASSALPAAEQQLNAAVARQNVLQANFDAQNEATNGLLIRLEALGQLASDNFTVSAARFLLFLLFLVIECLPVTVKLMQQPGNYEKILQEERNRELSDARLSYRRARQASVFAGTQRQRPRDDADIIEIFERQTRAMPAPSDDPSTTDPISQKSHFRPDQDPEQNVTAEDEHLSMTDRVLREMQDNRIPASSDGHGGGIPLPWDDDDL